MAPSQTTETPIELLCADLFFTAKIRAAATNLQRSIHLCSNPSQFGAGARAELIIIDLATPNLDIAACVRQLREASKSVPIIAFGRHTERQQREAAKAAGCTQVLARSEFVEQLAAILTRTGTS